MAKSGRRPPDLRDTLGSLVQSALEQVGVVREVVERGAQAQRNRYDTGKFERRRKDAMAALGEAVYRRAVRDNLGELADDPDVRARLEEIDNFDQRIEATGQKETSGFRANAGWPRSRRRSRGGDGEPTRVWRPVPPFAAPEGVDEDDELDDQPAPVPPPVDAAPAPVAQARSGGIRFGDDWGDDDDLEQYMHEDDVPQAAAPEPEPKPKPKPKPKAKPRKRRAAKRKTT